MIKKIINYSIAPLLSLLVFVIIFQAWKIDFNLPILFYHKDVFSHLFLFKNIIDTGWFFSNDLVGLPHFAQKFYLHDYPLNSDSFHFLIIRLLSSFSSNLFFVLNCFFIITFPLISFSSFIALRSFGISNYSAALVSILYAFIHYHLARSTLHPLLANYFIVPLIVMISLWFIDGKIRFLMREKGRICLSPSSYFLFSLPITILIATNGIYWAFYGCVLLFFSWLVIFIRSNRLFNEDLAVFLLFISLIIFVSILVNLPTFLYWIENGTNYKLITRSISDSNANGLKIADLLVPVSNHYFEVFANFSNYLSIFSNHEQHSEALGVLGSLGFLFLLFWLIIKADNDLEKGPLFSKVLRFFSFNENQKSLVSKLSIINLLSILFVTIGGFSVFSATFIPAIRSHARFSIFIIFFAFVIVALIFDRTIERKIFGSKVIAQVLIFFISVFALLDQVGKMPIDRIQSSSMKEKFYSDKSFIENLESKLPEGSKVFILPVFYFPEGQRDDYSSLVGYLHSKKLRWSYPVIRGREAYLWQLKVSSMPTKQFLSELRDKGFSGILINRSLIKGNRGEKYVLKDALGIKSLPKTKSNYISDNKDLVFISI